MMEQLPVGQGYKRIEILEAMKPEIQLDGIDYSDFFGFASMRRMINLFPKYTKICDVGCAWAVFAGEVQTMRPDIRVFSVNPAFALYQVRRETFAVDNDLFAAYNPELPFQTGYFDVTFDIWSSYHYNINEERQTEKISELMRITRKNGLLFLGPLPDEAVEESYKLIEKMQRVQKIERSIHGVMQDHYLALYV